MLDSKVKRRFGAAAAVALTIGLAGCAGGSAKAGGAAGNGAPGNGTPPGAVGKVQKVVYDFTDPLGSGVAVTPYSGKNSVRVQLPEALTKVAPETKNLNVASYDITARQLATTKQCALDVKINWTSDAAKAETVAPLQSGVDYTQDNFKSIASDNVQARALIYRLIADSEPYDRGYAIGSFGADPATRVESVDKLPSDDEVAKAIDNKEFSPLYGRYWVTKDDSKFTYVQACTTQTPELDYQGQPHAGPYQSFAFRLMDSTGKALVPPRTPTGATNQPIATFSIWSMVDTTLYYIGYLDPMKYTQDTHGNWLAH